MKETAVITMLVIIAIGILVTLGRLITVSRGDHAAPFGERGDTITIAPQTGVADDTGLPPEMQPAPLPAPVPEDEPLEQCRGLFEPLPHGSVTAELAERMPTPDELAELEAATRRILDRAAAADLATAELLDEDIWPAQEPFMAMLSDETIARGMPAVTA